MAVLYIVTGVTVMAALFFGSLALFLLSLGSVINHFGRSEQDDDET